MTLPVIKATGHEGRSRRGPNTFVAAGLILGMLAMVMPWWGFEGAISPTLGSTPSAGSNGFSGWGFGYLGFWLVAGALLALRTIPVGKVRTVSLPVPDSLVYAASGVLMIACAAVFGYAFITGPFSGPDSIYHLQPGWWLALVAPVIVLVGAWWTRELETQDSAAKPGSQDSPLETT